jgi:hypothetical protein
MAETEHSCDSCIVITDELDPNEHCDGCTNEMRLIDYVPPNMREGKRIHARMRMPNR